MHEHQKQFPMKVILEYAADQILRDRLNWLRDTVKYLNNLWLGPIYRKLITHPPVPFLVICHSRTGSNFLLWLLTSHSHILHIGEPFGNYHIRQPWVISHIREIGSVAYLKEGLQRLGNEDAVIFKIVYEHLEPHYAEHWGITDMDDLQEFIVNSPGLKVIHLKRRNRLQNLISHRIANVTKEYILFNPNKRVNDIQIELTPEECETEFSRIAELEKHYDALFAHHPMLEVWYENLYADTQGEGKRILQFMGMKQRRLQEQTVKQNIRPVTEVVKNYQALKAYFAGTIWEGIFDA